MKTNFPIEYQARINDPKLAISIKDSIENHNSIADFINNMQVFFEQSYDNMYSLNLIANSVVETSNKFGDHINNGPFLQSSTIALSGLIIFVGMDTDQKAAIKELKLHNDIKPDFENLTEIEENATHIIDLGYDGFYSLSPDMRRFYDYYEDLHSQNISESWKDRSRAGFGFPYAIIDKVIKLEEMAEFQEQIDSEINWDLELASLDIDKK